MNSAERIIIIRQTIKWYEESAAALADAGGNAVFIVDNMNDKTLEALVCNSITLKYNKDRSP